MSLHPSVCLYVCLWRALNCSSCFPFNPRSTMSDYRKATVHDDGHPRRPVSPNTPPPHQRHPSPLHQFLLLLTTHGHETHLTRMRLAAHSWQRLEGRPWHVGEEILRVGIYSSSSDSRPLTGSFRLGLDLMWLEVVGMKPSPTWAVFSWLIRNGKTRFDE